MNQWWLILTTHICVIRPQRVNGWIYPYKQESKVQHHHGVRLISKRCSDYFYVSLQSRNSELAGVSNHQPHDCLLNRLFRRRSKKTSKLRVTGLCAGNSPVTSEFPAQMASNAENVSIWWRHHDFYLFILYLYFVHAIIQFICHVIHDNQILT